ncbi:putative vegetative incompatibility protein HET-E-1 [Rhizoctonia solani 123E]|uniref:Putative vegetative incompatibility protein HET-E-1 n=1 Tax=Rhizoctonia solani 123E TaxID=1423351 RepID=A0A074RHP2_9AGAM|nr:putative vegetative incompatibility protein HET-E-1 [Rhizoctonia solani 123E]
MVSDTPSAKWKGLKQFTRVLEPISNLFGPIKETVDLFMECVDKYEMTGVAKIEYEALRVRLEGLFEDLNGYFGKGCSVTMTSSMENLCRSIQAELDYIKKQQDRNIGERYLSAADESEKVLACYRRIEGHLQRLSNSQTDRMLSFVDRLPSSLPALYDSAEGIELKRRQCTPGTRVNVLANVLDWTRSAGGGVYWLNGMAGTGKTTIAYSVCADLDSRRQLGASFFCSRLREECRNVNVIIPSIAYQLARFSRPYQSALSTVLEKDPDVHGRLPHLQFDALIAQPMLEVQHTLPQELIVVIDALDECEQKESTTRMLDVLLSKSASLPVKFIVSSRPESQIHDQMASERTRSRLVLHELDKGEVQADIEKYLREGLAQMHPSEAQIAVLVERAGILFIYAATAVRYIGYDNFHRNPSARLRTILERPQGRITTQDTEVDQLYGAILEAALGDAGLDEADRVDMQRVLHTVICAREPLTVGGISELLQINDPDCVRGALRPLWSVVHVVVGSELVTTLHASFPDFMFDPTRSKAHYCDSGAHNRILAEHCLKRITLTKPEFNICGLESSYLPDCMVPHIQERVANAIPSDLLYACRYWADHVEVGNCASTLAAQLRDFLTMRLLIWMEVLNLHKQMRTGVSCMKRVVEWCNQFESDEELIKLASDALRFVETFASNPVSQSTPHIYLSMLTFWPKSGPMANHYARFTHGPVEAGGTALDQRQPAYLAAWRYAGDIWSIAMSQDGKHIALGFNDDVLVVDSSGGQLILGPLHGLSGLIETVMFSPDQTRVFACSSDYHSRTATIVGWDTGTGATAVGPLQFDGRMNSTSITFWPDRTCVASCFDDYNIFLWDAENRKMLRSLKTQILVQTVAFSPDGIFIAAGLDQALQVWNSQTGEATFGPLSTGEVDRIAFSPDSSRIVHNQRSSGIDTVYVRDAQNGQLTHELNIGIKDITTRIKYSPDGRHIVSSHREIVMLWDAQSGNMVLGPLEGHTDEIDAVTFSPDGSRIISACTGGLVCTWGTQHRDLAPSSISARSRGILSAMFSPDGQHFVSGTDDGSLYIRDSHTGAMTVGPIRAHTAGGIDVEFSKDNVVSGFGDGVIIVCSAQSGEVLRSLTVAPGHEIGSIAFSPNGKFIATGSKLDSSSEINLWDAQTGIRVLGLFTFTDPDEFIPSVLFSPDSNRIAAHSWSEHCPIIVLDASDGRNLFGRLDGHTSFVCSASYSPDGALIASGSTDNTVIVWDAYTGSKLLGPLVGHSDRVDSVSFSPDSTRLISGSDDGTIRIWDVQTGATLLELPHGHEQVISSVAYSPDGTRILTLSWDKSVRIHDARSAEERVGHLMLCITSCTLTSLAHIP